MKVRVVGSVKQPGRCAYCHDSLEAVGHRCGSCGTWLHLDCWQEAKVCTSPGCTEEAPSRDVSIRAKSKLTRDRAARLGGRAHLRSDEDLRAWAREAIKRQVEGQVATGPYVRLLIGLASNLALLVALVALAVFLVPQIPDLWGIASRGDSPVLSMLGITGPSTLAAGAFAYYLIRSLLKWPKDWGDVKRLLALARPEPFRMRVWSETVGNKTTTYAEFRRLSGSVQTGMGQLDISSFIPPPGWLTRSCTSQPVLVYGVGTREPPFLIENAAGDLALIQA